MLALSPEGPEDGPQIEALLDRAFGPDRLKKKSYRYREGVAPLPELCLVARERGLLVGSIRYWPIRLEEHPALLLGPLAIDPSRQGLGIGRALTHATLQIAQAEGWRLIFLVGDPGYYVRYGFQVAPPTVVMPGENAARLQFRGLAGATLPPEGGVLLRAALEPGQERPLHPGYALVAGHARLHLADPQGHGAGYRRVGGDLAQPADEGADGEDHRPGRREPAQRLALDPQPQEIAGILGREAGYGHARLRVE